MKKLLLAALALGIALGTVSFAQDTTKPETAKKTKKKAKKSKKSAEDANKKM